MKFLQKQWVTIIIFTFIAWAIVGCNRGGPFVETFDEPGTWRAGTDANVEGSVEEGVYSLLVKSDVYFSWSTAGQNFSDGTYQVEATQVAGPLDNGYGMLFRVDDENDNFYVFEVSGDGFVWIGSYRNAGQDEAAPLVGDWWFESSAVNTGLNQTNVLRVEAEGNNLIFLVNDQEVGRVTDDSFSSGDIGMMVETFGEGNVEVHFDNFTVTPLES